MIQQLLYIIRIVITLPLFPLLLWQGRRVQRLVPRLPEATLNTSGATGSGAAQLKLLLLGESTVAGVGVQDHAQGLSGQIASSLASNTGKNVQWQVLAKSGYTAAAVRIKLIPVLPSTAVDLLVIGLGANDAFALKSPLAWQRDIKKLIAAIRMHQPDCPIVFAHMPPIEQFPALPPLMRSFFGGLVQLNKKVLLELSQNCSNVYVIDAPINSSEWVKQAAVSDDPASFFSDGIHPSALAYTLWGKEIAAFILNAKLI